MQMAGHNIWLIRAPDCLVPRGAEKPSGLCRLLMINGSCGLSHPRSSLGSLSTCLQSRNLSPAQDDLIILMRLSLTACSTTFQVKVSSPSSPANLSTCGLCLPTTEMWVEEQLRLHGAAGTQGSTFWTRN